MARIRLEASRGVVLAHCAACPPWRELRSNRGAALLAAAAHAELVHGDQRAAAHLREQARRWQARHAGKSNNSGQ